MSPYGTEKIKEMTCFTANGSHVTEDNPYTFAEYDLYILYGCFLCNGSWAGV
jgi:hypothetical protein